MGAYRDAFGRIYLEWDATMRTHGTNLTTKLNMVRRPSELADQGTLDLAILAQHLTVLAQAVDAYISRIETIYELVNDLQADVEQAARTWQAPPQPDNGMLEDEELIDRLGSLYGIPKPKGRR